MIEPPPPAKEVNPFNQKTYESETGLTMQALPHGDIDISYVIDYISLNNNEIMTAEEGCYITSAVYGRGSERLSQKISPAENITDSPNASIATDLLGKVYFQWDNLGSTVFASDSTGNQLSYLDYGPLGECGKW